jgi:hypothetical protein
MMVESSVAVLLAVTIGYCIILNGRLKRLHADRDMLSRIVGDLVQATGLANAAIKELKTAALEADGKLDARLQEAEEFERDLARHVSTGTALIEKIVKITAAAKTHALAEAKVAVEMVDDPVRPVAQPQAVELRGRLHSALQQLAMRPGIVGRAA